ncbi:hypothetical protein RNJ44_02263 [Nakaseomyces bracarensis]|uniref:Uncharacterized protein n=1 Tax=Nakaseomyces bracarensis TaxID=273131 RepID=A0ABR4NMZ3_9SACH
MTRFNFTRGDGQEVTKTKTNDTHISQVATNTTSSTDSGQYGDDEERSTRARATSSVDGKSSMSMSSDEKPKNPLSEEYSADMQPLQFKMSRRRTTPLNRIPSASPNVHQVHSQTHIFGAVPQPPLNIRADSNPSPRTTPRADPIKSLRFDEGNLSSTTAGTGSDTDTTRVESQRDAFAKVREHIQRGSATNSTGFFKSEFNPFAFIDSEQFETYLKEPRYIKIFKKRSRSAKQFRRLFLAQELKTAAEPSDIDNAIANGLIAPGVAEGLQPNVSIGNATLNGNNFRDNIAESSPDNQSDSTLCGGMPNLSIGGGAAASASNDVSNTKAIWSTKFSLDGKYMATGSRDGTIRVWKVLSSPVERWGIDSSIESVHLTSAKSLRLQQNHHQSNLGYGMSGASPSIRRDTFESVDSKENSSNLYAPVFHPSPIKTFREHEQDVLVVDWSKNSFLLSGSMDKTVKLWHPLKKKSLKTFVHPDFVTCVKFHPTDDRFFISGCLDQKCRLWSILDNDVSFEFNCKDLVTSLAVSPGDGIYTIVGTFNGYIHVLQTKGLEHITSFHVTAKKTHENTHGVLNPNNDTKVRHGPRVMGLQCFNSLIDGSLRLVVTSSDSRIRIFDLTRRKLLEILKGFQCGSSQHKAQLSVFNNQPVVISSSDDHWVYGWRLKSSDPVEINKKAKKKSNMTRSGSIRSLFSKSISRSSSQGSEEKQGLRNTLKLTSLLPMPHTHHHGDGVVKNSEYFSFHAHNAPVTTVAIAPEETSKTLSLSNDPICELSLEFFEPTDEVDIIKLKNRHSIDGTEGRSSVASSTGTSLPKPTPVEAIGTILISTDNNGLIRVFRADMSKSIRTRVLEKLHAYNNELDKQYGSTDSLVSEHEKPRPSMSTTTNSGIGLHVPPTNGNSSNNLSATPNNKCGIVRNHSFRSLKAFKSPTTSLSNTALASNRSPRDSISSSRSEALPNIASVGVTFPGLKCHICDCTRFEPISRNGSQDKSYYCVDCKTLLNSFR